MKELAVAAFCLFVALPAMAANESKEKPVQHLKVLDVKSMQEAQEIFVEKTSEFRSKEELDQAVLPEVHIITYTLEKSVAYFVGNLDGERQALAKEIAVVVEDIHVSSENGRLADTKMNLTKYLTLADKFAAGF